MQALNLRLIGRLDPDGTRLWKNMRKSGNGMLQTIYMAFTDGDGDGMSPTGAAPPQGWALGGQVVWRGSWR